MESSPDLKVKLVQDLTSKPGRWGIVNLVLGIKIEYEPSCLSLSHLEM